MIGQRMRRKQVSIDRRWHKGAAVVRGFHPQETTGPAEIDQIDGGAQSGREPTTHIEKRYGIQRLVAEHPHIDIAVAAGLSPRVASVQPRAEESAMWEGSSHFVAQGFGETIGSKHAPHHTRPLTMSAWT